MHSFQSFIWTMKEMKRKTIPALSVKQLVLLVLMNVFLQNCLLYVLKYNIFIFLTTGCENEKFGTNCSNHCSGNCLFQNTCNSTNGHCDNGCESGYLEEFCNKSMLV